MAFVGGIGTVSWNQVPPRMSLSESSGPVPIAVPGRKVVGLGSAGLDLLASVTSFPNPDDKIRTSAFETAGGGNCANTLTAIRRLGLSCEMLTKVGDDTMGGEILDELQGDGVDVSRVIREKGGASGFTYIIVDTTDMTRTCIHTPASSELTPSDVQSSWLDGASHLHLDGRHTPAATEIARRAVELGVPISLDIEKDRPHVRDLLPMADYVITNSRYPLVFGEDMLSGMFRLLKLGRAKMVVSTVGSDGSLLMRKQGFSAEDVGGLMTENLVLDGEEVQLIRCPAAKVSRIVDTTGAGDAFIGGVIYSLVCGFPASKMLRLASTIASAKLEQPGARKGLPMRAMLDGSLL